MDNFGEITINELWIWLLGAWAVIKLLCEVGEKIVKIVRAAKAPNKGQDERLDALESWKEEVDEKLGTDKKRLDTIDAGNRASMRALLALLDHGIDGNNINQMQTAKEELTNLLINR